ncbi:MAG: heat shock protein transcriptional repressor HspR [Coriobacteriales bacterium]
MSQTDKNRPLYMISVAADLAGLHPQTLRIYESKGLVTPQRTSGNTRMYSQADVERLELITQLTDEGINLAGVVRILDMKERMAKQEAENEELRRQLAQAQDQLHEYEVRQTITTLAKRDDGGAAALAQLMGRQIPRGLM